MLCAALLAAAFAFASWADEAGPGEPSEESVLEKAREKYQNDQDAQLEEGEESAEDREEAAEALEPEAGSQVVYVPFLVSFAPMVSFPMGFYDTSLSGACVGAILHDVNGFAGAGVFNLAHDIRGFAGAGVFNIAHDFRGGLGAGVFNITHEASGFQGAGVFNISSRTRGFQGAGVFNMTDDLDGVQGAGVYNVAGDLRGLQAAGVVNVARRVEGVQIGLVNLADEVDGVQIGLVNFARHGVTGSGLYYEPDSDWLFAYFQNGGRHLYTVLTAGAPRGDWFVSSDSAVFSAGLGTRIGGGRGEAYLDLEAAACQEFRPISAAGSELCAAETESEADAAWARFASSLSVYPELRLRLGLPLFGGLELVGGLSVDFDLADYPNLPESRKGGWSYGGRLFGEDFGAYTRWFVGIKI